MTSWSSNFSDNPTEGTHKVKCKGCNCFLEYESLSDNLLKYRSVSLVIEIIQTRLMKNLKSDSGIHLISILDINKFILLLRKGVYPHEYLDEWEKFNETLLPKK